MNIVLYDTETDTKVYIYIKECNIMLTQQLNLCQLFKKKLLYPCSLRMHYLEEKQIFI